MKKITWILAFFTLIAASAILQFMPERLPTHTDLNGNIDAYGSKYLYLIIPVMIIIITAFFSLMGDRIGKNGGKTADDKAAAEAKNNARVFEIASLAVTALLSVTLFIALYNAYVSSDAGLAYLEIDGLKITTILMGVLFIIAGNYLPKTKLNGDIGLRISYSMYNDNTWRKSNRFAAKALMTAGALSIATTAIVGGMASIVMLLIYLFAAVTVIIIYARKVYTEEIGKQR